jgi:hypothetical protein
MRDQLLDLVQHTYGLGVIDAVKITGTATETIIESVAENRSLVLQGKFKAPVAEFVGTFGMPNLGKLNTILNIPEYAADANFTINTVNKNGVDIPAELHFENKAGDFKNDYRFMTLEAINEKLKSVAIKPVNWDIQFSPTVANIQRLKFQTAAHSEETFFSARTENKTLKISFGDHSTHAGSFVFASDIAGTLNNTMRWPVALVNTILSLPGDKQFHISNSNLARITVDSGIAEYTYLLPAVNK